MIAKWPRSQYNTIGTYIASDRSTERRDYQSYVKAEGFTQQPLKMKRKDHGILEEKMNIEYIYWKI